MEKHENFKVLFLILDAAFFGIIKVMAVLTGVTAIFLWPLAIFMILFQALASIIFLPLIVCILYPVSLYFYRRDIDGPFEWIFLYTIIGGGYALMLGYMTENLQSAAGLIVFSGLLGALSWIDIYKTKFDAREKA